MRLKLDNFEAFFLVNGKKTLQCIELYQKNKNLKRKGMKKERRKTYGWLVEKRPVDWIDECRSNFLGQFFEKLFHILQSGTTNRIFLILATQICFIKRVNERSATQVRGARRKTVKKKSRSFF